MSKVFFISDLHLGHGNSLNWARDYRYGDTADEMNMWLMSQWNSVVRKRDLVWVLGDVCMVREDMAWLGRMNGRKKLILGNHDNFELSVYERYFEEVCAYRKYKGFWLSHMPIHEYDMVNCRVKGNIHGHLHQNLVEDSRYHNVCVEHSYGVPVWFEDILTKHKEANSG